MTKDEALKLALEALEGYESCIDGYYADAVCPQIDKAITAIKEALAQPEPEYIAFMDTPQRKPLTDEEALELWNKHEKHWRFENNALAFARAIEAAHGIKGEA